MDKKLNYSLQSVERALKLLHLFSEQRQDLSLSEISKLLCIAKPVAFKYVNTLEFSGFLRRDKETKRYSLGLNLITLGHLAKQSISIIKIAHPEILSLSKEIQETVYLLSPDLPFYQATVIDVVESLQTVTSKYKMSSVLYAGAGRKAILAYLGEDFFQKMISEIDMISFTDQTVVDTKVLSEQLEEIRRSGYAISSEETVYDAGAIAVPIFDYSGIVGSISIYVPLYRFTEEIKPFLIKKILITAQKISENLGYRNNHTEKSRVTTELSKI